RARDRFVDRAHERRSSIATATRTVRLGTVATGFTGVAVAAVDTVGTVDAVRTIGTVTRDDDAAIEADERAHAVDGRDRIAARTRRFGIAADHREALNRHIHIERVRGDRPRPVAEQQRRHGEVALREVRGVATVDTHAALQLDALLDRSASDEHVARR